MAYTNVDDARKYLGIDSSADDALLASWIPAAKSQIDQRCKRTFEALADETRFYNHDDLIRSQWQMTRDTASGYRGNIWDTAADRYYIQGGGSLLDLVYDIVSVTTLVNGDGTVITPDHYWLLPRNTFPKNAIQLKSAFRWNLSLDQEIAVTGRFAYSLTAPADIVLATHELIAYWYRTKDSQVFDTVTVGETGQIIAPKGFPASVQRILEAGNYIDPLGVI